MTYIKRGTSEFKKVNIALFAGGFCTFALLWGTQPLLPEFAEEFHISPASSSISQTSTTVALAISLLIAGSLSEIFGRKTVMFISLVASSILSVITGFVPNFGLLILCRILQGITLAGLPAVAMAYLGEEIEKKSLGMAMGLYISGNSIGGMAGRIINGILTDYFGWHIALIGIGIVSLLATIIFWLVLPPSTHFKPRTFRMKHLVITLFSQFKAPGLIYLFFIGFLLQAGFVSLYNYIGFELIKPPYSLSQTLIGFIFVVYIVGTFSSTWMGMLADQYGKRKILQLSIIILLIGVCITLNLNIWLKIFGLAIFTFGFFAGHSIASSWVGELAANNRAQAASLYLFSYYSGGSVMGTATGVFYDHFDWLGVVAMIAVLSLISLLFLNRLGTVTKEKFKFSPHKIY
ncbi:MFS transporter [Bacillus sp. CMF21]|uniref:MFS transporter n=1 Tax=Metabacillus dongyingensis TaxID=2874282 RepID=UPI001CC089C0|nr:MFS transporter [Metabacillus dongyingensis]UAL50571.1 MFS transporter [Metabacillus dongyingensis]USK26835.1 MFS transporter [Bacillus sp. CMF21]